MWCPKPMNIVQDSGFGLPIYLSVDFLTVLQVLLQTQPRQSNFKYSCDFQPKHSLPLRLFFLFSMLSLFFHPLCVFLPLSFSFYSSLPSLKNQPPNLSALTSLYNLPLVGFKSLLFTNSHTIPLSPIIPRKIMSSESSLKTCSCAKLRLAANSLKALLSLVANLNLSISSLISHRLIGQ